MTILNRLPTSSWVWEANQLRDSLFESYGLAGLQVVADEVMVAHDISVTRICVRIGIQGLGHCGVCSLAKRRCG